MTNEETLSSTRDIKFINRCMANKELIIFVQSKFNRLSKANAQIIILNLLANQSITIKKMTEKSDTLETYNKTRFDKDGNINLDFLKSLRREFKAVLEEHDIELPYDKDEIKKHDNILLINKHTTYEEFRQRVCEEDGESIFKYDFDNLAKLKSGSKIKITTPDFSQIPQRCRIQILSKPIKFDYPTNFTYFCVQCEHRESNIPAYKTASNGTRIKCTGIYSYINATGESKTRTCNNTLLPDDELSWSAPAYFFEMGYENKEGDKFNASAFSFNKMEPGFYEAILYKVNNPKKTELYHIVDVKEIKSNDFEFPEQKESENYIFTIQKRIDEFIKYRTGVYIDGMNPIKCALIIQKAMIKIHNEPKYNVQCIGHQSVGKSLVLKYYGFTLHNNLHLSTNGDSISIAGLRGTQKNIVLLGKQQCIITMGHLGSFDSIHIDEAGENKELVKKLKTFLLETNYSYDRAGSDGNTRKRKAHANISENIDTEHLGMYRGKIKKAYKNLPIKIENIDKPEWDENWDLHKQLWEYDNPYLFKVIREIRSEYTQQFLWWIDKYDYALHQRFPFYFFLVAEKPNENLDRVLKENVSRETISENLELMKALKSKDIDKFFEGLKEYDDGYDDKNSFDKVDKILADYHIEADARSKEFYYNLVKISRIINQRYNITEMDYDLLRWFIEKTNCKLDIVDTNDYKIIGTPDFSQIKHTEEQIDSAKEDTVFGLQGDDFDA